MSVCVRALAGLRYCLQNSNSLCHAVVPRRAPMQHGYQHAIARACTRAALSTTAAAVVAASSSSAVLCGRRLGSSVTRAKRAAGKGRERKTITTSASATPRRTGQPTSMELAPPQLNKGANPLHAEEKDADAEDDNDADAAADELEGTSYTHDNDMGEYREEENTEGAPGAGELYDGGTRTTAQRQRGEDVESEEAAPITPESRRLVDLHPDLATEYTAAGDANDTPVGEIMAESASVVSWACLRCHTSWKCGVFVRCILKTGCPQCTASASPSAATVRPELMQLWDSQQNDPFDTLDEIPADSRKMALWRCTACGRSHRARVKDKVAEKVPCPSCALARMQSAEVLAQEDGALTQEWHPIRNGDLSLSQVHPSDYKTKLWWLCSACGHEWEATLVARLSSSRRARGKACPVCKGLGVGSAQTTQ